MHHVIVTRVSATLCLLLAACILGFAMLADRSTPAGPIEPAESPSAESVSGAGQFEIHCSRCHDVEELTEPLRAAQDRDVLLDEWRDLLQRHGRAGGEQDRAILEYLERQSE